MPKNRFLSSYFGKSAALQKLALAMIAEGRKDVLLDQNKAVKVLGNSVDSDRVIKNLEKNDGFTYSYHGGDGKDTTPQGKHSEDGCVLHPFSPQFRIFHRIIIA